MTYQGTIESIKAKTDKAGETLATVTLKISTWNPERELPALLSMLKEYVSVEFQAIERPESMEE